MEFGQRDDLDGLPGPSAGGGLHIRQAHCTHLAVVLGDDDVWSQRLQRVPVDAVDGETVAHDLLYAGVDLGARSLDLELGRRQRGQTLDLGRKVALMAAAHEPAAAPEPAHDLGNSWRSGSRHDVDPDAGTASSSSWLRREHPAHPYLHRHGPAGDRRPHPGEQGSGGRRGENGGRRCGQVVPVELVLRIEGPVKGGGEPIGKPRARLAYTQRRCRHAGRRGRRSAEQDDLERNKPGA